MVANHEVRGCRGASRDASPQKPKKTSAVATITHLVCLWVTNPHCCGSCSKVFAGSFRAGFGQKYGHRLLRNFKWVPSCVLKKTSCCPESPPVLKHQTGPRCLKFNIPARPRREREKKLLPLFKKEYYFFVQI